MKTVIRAEGPKVFINLDERTFLEMEPKAALELAAAIRHQALAAEEYLQRERLAMDGAILARAGAPFTLSDRPDVLDRVRTEAAWNGDLRRYMPGEVKAREVFGNLMVAKETR